MEQVRELRIVELCPLANLLKPNGDIAIYSALKFLQETKVREHYDRIFLYHRDGSVHTFYGVEETAKLKQHQL